MRMCPIPITAKENGVTTMSTTKSSKSIAPELSKNRAVIDSVKALAVLAQSLGPKNENVKDALEGIVDPANGSLLHYWLCKGCTTHKGAFRNQCVSCNEAKDLSGKMKLAIEDESTAE
eukprot:1652111-Ditylum_brightwellii.AAC.1